MRWDLDLDRQTRLSKKIIHEQFHVFAKPTTWLELFVCKKKKILPEFRIVYIYIAVPPYMK
jgi:hypothetical protein